MNAEQKKYYQMGYNAGRKATGNLVIDQVEFDRQRDNELREKLLVSIFNGLLSSNKDWTIAGKHVNSMELYAELAAIGTKLAFRKLKGLLK